MTAYTPGSITGANGLEDMARQVNEELEKLQRALQLVNDFETSKAVTKVPQPGIVAPLRYTDGQSWDPGFGAGFYFYNGANWIRLASHPEVTTYLPLKAFMLSWSPSGGINTDASYNIDSVVYQGLGVYRVALTQGTVYGQVIRDRTVAGFHVLATAKTDEGTVTAVVQPEGGTPEAPWFEVYLSETYIAGQNLRERPYTLTGTEELTGFGLLNYVSPLVPVLPTT